MADVTLSPSDCFPDYETGNEEIQGREKRWYKRGGSSIKRRGAQGEEGAIGGQELV